MAPRSRAQLAEKLTAQDVPAEVALEVLDRFEEVGLVDDKTFAEGWVHSRSSGRGRRALARELRLKGVDDETAAEALDVVDDESQYAAARLLVQRKAGSTVGLERAVRERRLFGMLARRGFPSDIVVRVVREELQDEA
jgi:regulatory protein